MEDHDDIAHRAAQNAAEMVDITSREDVREAIQNLTEAVLNLTYLYEDLGLDKSYIVGTVVGTAGTIAAEGLLEDDQKEEDQ